MKRLIFVSLLFTLSISASAQERSVEFRQGDALRGPVKSARIERATFGRVDGRLVEGTRSIVVVSNYTPDGKRKEYEGYAPDGTLIQRYVHIYDDNGNEVEVSSFDGGGKLLTKKVSRPSLGETLTYNGDESLRERRVAVKGPDGKLAEILIYDGGGALRERSVNEKDDKTSVWSTYAADGSLKRRDVHALNTGGPHRTETRTYAPDGSVAGRRVSNVDASVRDLRAAETKGDGAAPRKTRETREYDPRGNLSKLVNYSWNAETKEYEPAAVLYYTVEYYR
ncbi:MAG TPA: hypothetical protein VF297_16285 [Pyrinomonadaceae bacterium]